MPSIAVLDDRLIARREDQAFRACRSHPAFGMLDADFPDRDGRDPQTFSLAGLIQLLDARVRQPLGVSFRVPSDQKFRSQD